MEFMTPVERATMMQVDEKAVFFHRLFGMSAGLPARVWTCIQAGKARRRSKLTVRSDAVPAEWMLERSALSVLSTRLAHRSH